jgi:type I restriction enzyme S subunit
MNPAPLLSHFDRISDAPDSIPRLRRFILDLAVRGKLVEQNLGDESAFELLRRIQEEKGRLVKKGMIRWENPQDKIEADEIPFPLPDNWAWVRLGSVIHLVSGQHLQPSEYSGQQQSGPPYITGPADFGQNGLVITRYAVVRKAVANKGQILLTVKGAGVGKTAICNLPEVAISRQLMAMTAIEWSQQFLLLVTHRLAETLKGSARSLIPGISRKDVDKFIFPLPPLAEQHRIVAKVDELMALCDRLEAAQTEQESRRDRLVTSSLHRLNNGADTDAFHDHARFYFNHLPRLTTRTEHIQQLRQTILSLAVRGKLVPQDPNDEPASELVKRVQTEKERLFQNGGLRKEASLPPVTADAEPFPIPTSWSWARIGTCSLLNEYGTSVKSDSGEIGVPVLKMGDIQDGKLILGGQNKVPRQIDDLPQLFLKRFDLLYNRTNSAELVGKTGIYLGEDDTYTFASYLIRIRFPNKLMSPVYSNVAMNAPYFRVTQILPELKQQCGQANVNGTKLRNMVIPVPPLAEQYRIVAKVDELMALCDRLETQLTTTHTDRRHLLEAVVREALSGNLVASKYFQEKDSQQ